MNQNINDPKTNQYPFWTPPFGIQNPRQIVGGGIDSMIEDLQYNRIPSETDYLNSDIRVIPTPSTNVDTRTARTFQVKPTPLGRGSGRSLVDMLLQSQLESNQIGGNQ
jgi:hypothetical protein